MVRAAGQGPISAWRPWSCSFKQRCRSVLVTNTSWQRTHGPGLSGFGAGATFSNGESGSKVELWWRSAFTGSLPSVCGWKQSCRTRTWNCALKTVYSFHYLWILVYHCVFAVLLSLVSVFSVPFCVVSVPLCFQQVSLVSGLFSCPPV